MIACGTMDADVVVVGGGHAAIEAALAAARLGLATLLITQNLDTIGKLSCNPAVGGLAKGTIVREIDALGGEMARLIDATMIQFRLLNRSRGPAVQAPRAQADKWAYQALAKQTLEQQSNLQLFQDTVTEILTDSRRQVTGVATERGLRIGCRAVVLTTGTFLNGIIYIGEYRAGSGRLGEPAAVGLDRSLKMLGLRLGRMKTGTPARVGRSSLDLGKMQRQKGDPEPFAFSFGSAPPAFTDNPCYITFTNERTHQIIRESMDRSPLYSGEIAGKGPRYCPSIEDKVVKFPDRDRHQIFVEPEGEDSEEMYLNGISSSLPEVVQEQFLRTVPGLEHVQVMRPGYAVEYDYLDPVQLTPSLETKAVHGLFVAGQTNGSSGYEEAAAQGLIAGINAVRWMSGGPPLVLGRDQAYIGVLVDDLVTLGTDEPYRMFTSRAEHRIALRHDTADQRLTPIGHQVGLVGEPVMARLQEKLEKIDMIKDLLRRRTVDAALAEAEPALAGHQGRTLHHALKDPAFVADSLLRVAPDLAREYTRALLDRAVIDVKYEGYLARQEREIARMRKLEAVRIPDDFDYRGVDGISSESREKLNQIRPVSLGQASRVSGVRSADLAVLSVAVQRIGRRERSDG